MTRILVIEDNPQNLKLAQVILRHAGYEASGVPDADEADRHIGTHGVPDLILMDLGLPGRDGYSYTRDLRQRPETHDVPILAVTSFAMKGDEAKAIEAGCTGYLTKPIHRAPLLEAIESTLAGPGEAP